MHPPSPEQSTAQGEETRGGSRAAGQQSSVSAAGSTLPTRGPDMGLGPPRSSRTSTVARLAEEHGRKPGRRAGRFLPGPRPRRSGDVTRTGRAQPTTFLTLRAARPPPLHAARMSRAPSWRRHHPTAERAPETGGRGRARAPESRCRPRPAAWKAKKSGPGARTSAAARAGKAARRAHPRG